MRFNSRTPCGVRPSSPRQRQRWTAFQFTHPVWGATSPLSPLAPVAPCFNSRTPCGVRLYHLACAEFWRKFQFTHPVWGATEDVAVVRDPCCVSIHAPRVGCDVYGAGEEAVVSVSIHAPRVGCDTLECVAWLQEVVSIHAPRVGCDCQSNITMTKLLRFNSRTPCGVRQQMPQEIPLPEMFQFTHPVWGATGISQYQCYKDTGFNSRTPCGVRQRCGY